MSQHSQSSDPLADFGANEWLVDEMYDQYLKDKSSVDASWQTYFATRDGADSAGSNGGTPAAAPAAKAAPAPAADPRPGARQPGGRAAVS